MRLGSHDISVGKLLVIAFPLEGAESQRVIDFSVTAFIVNNSLLVDIVLLASPAGWEFREEGPQVRLGAGPGLGPLAGLTGLACGGQSLPLLASLEDVVLTLGLGQLIYSFLRCSWETSEGSGHIKTVLRCSLLLTSSC